MIRDAAAAAADDLAAPLGQTPPSPPAKRLNIAALLGPVVAALLGLLVAVFVGWTLFVSAPLGGEPSAVAVVAAPRDSADAPAKPAAARQAVPEPPASPAAPSTVTIIDGSTGKRQEVPIGGTPSAEGQRTNGGDPKLLETSRHGLIPKIAADGTRPADAYARPPALPAKQDMPLIAIVIDGLGIGANATTGAISKLPAAITFAFAPYGAEVDRAVARARDGGHEVVLQVPMEPFDYPDNDPGPQTLLTSLSTDQNVDRLYWMMSRFQGYVGIANYMGARFSSTEAALTPVLKEASKRGLLYFEDGVAPRSLAAQVAGANKLPFAKTDIVLDAVPTPAEIAKALSKLEGAARLNGLAIGVASALPVSIERIALWAKNAESRGFMLVPISVAAAKGKPS